MSMISFDVFDRFYMPFAFEVKTGGEDVLKDKKDDFLPIIWKGYSAKMQAYQGEIMSKKDIQNRFFQKLSASRGDRVFLNAADWRDLIAIFEMIFDCFNDQKNHYQSTLAPH